MWWSATQFTVGFVLLGAGLAAIFTGSPWVGFALVILAVFVLGV